ncbi:MAG: NUDIX hydrolase [Bacillaceae bacterium]|nr:NUDIX hydrolase [Bacillaceae bacterium]
MVKNAKNFHRAFGVYGICEHEGRLLVIKKNTGPYINRFDLLGGSLKEGESLLQALKREFHEETGFEIEVLSNAGTVDFILPWKWRSFTHVHHIAVFYHVKITGGQFHEPERFDGQDSLGSLWINDGDVTGETASPLVLKAFEWTKIGILGMETVTYDTWEIKMNGKWTT